MAAKPQPPIEPREVVDNKGGDLKRNASIYHLYGLTVKVISGKDLIAADVGGKSDPYVVLILDGKNKKQTAVKAKTLNPEWNEGFSFTTDQMPGSLKISVMDKDKVSADDFLGEATIELGSAFFVPVAGAEKKVFDGDVKLNKVKTGTIKLRIEGTIVPTVVQEAIDIPKEEVTHVLRLTVIGARGLSSSIVDKSDPFATVSFGLHIYQTKPKVDTVNPVWNQMCPLLVTKDTMDHVIKIQVFDKDFKVLRNKDDFLGCCLLKPNMFPEGKSVEFSIALKAENPGNDAQMAALIRDLKACDLNAKDVKGPKGVLQLRAELLPYGPLRDEFFQNLCVTYDRDKNQKFDFTEVEHMCAQMGSKLDSAKIQEIFRKADANGDGELSKDELLTLLKSNAFLSDDALRKLHLEIVHGKEGVDKFMTRGLFNHEIDPVPDLERGPSIDNEGEQVFVLMRGSGAVVQENIPGYIKSAMTLAYRTSGGKKVMDNDRIKKTLAHVTITEGKKMDLPASKAKIDEFIELHKLDPNECLLKRDEFKTFNEFFYRKLKAGARPCPTVADPTIAISPADCRLMVFSTINKAKELWIKGEKFTVGNVFGSYDPTGEKAAQFTGGSMVIARLAPQDYHRWHWPVSGVVGARHMIDGEYNTVNPIAIRRKVDVYTTNKRCICPIETREFGTVILVAVGAAMVGSIRFEEEKDEGKRVSKMDPHGYFAFGGSTVLVFFKPGSIYFDKDLLENSSKKLETLVKVGERIGTAVSA